jgi:hypothetical protein
LIAGAVDFVERPPSGRLDRAKRLPWWAAFVRGLARAKTPAPRRQFATLERWRAWLGRSVWPQLLRATAATGAAVEDVLRDLGLLTARMASRASPAVSQYVLAVSASSSDNAPWP